MYSFLKYINSNLSVTNKVKIMNNFTKNPAISISFKLRSHMFICLKNIFIQSQIKKEKKRREREVEKDRKM